MAILEKLKVQSMTFADFIDQKGVQKLSVVLGVPVGTIYSWKSHNRVPRRVWPDLMTKMPEVGLADLVGMENLAPREA